MHCGDGSSSRPKRAKMSEVRLPPIRVLDDFLLGSTRLAAPDVRDLQRWHNRVINNLLYYQSNYLLLLGAGLLLGGPLQVLVGTKSLRGSDILEVQAVRLRGCLPQPRKPQVLQSQLQLPSPPCALLSQVTFTIFFLLLATCGWPGCRANLGVLQPPELQCAVYSFVLHSWAGLSLGFALLFVTLEQRYFQPMLILLSCLLLCLLFGGFVWAAENKPPLRRFRRNYPGSCFFAILGAAYFLVSLFEGSATFLVFIALPIMLSLIHASLRLRNLKNKIENKIENIGLKRTPMGLLLEAVGQEQEAGS